MKRTVRFTLNSRKFGSQTTVEGVHVGDDNSCELIISVTDGNKILDLSSETTVATMCGTKPDGTTISRPCSIVNNNIVYTLEKQDTAVSGNVLYQVTVTSDNGISQSIIATAKFTVAVMKNIYIPIYRVLESEPSDWSTNYRVYYRLLNNKYTAISDSSCPAFLKDTFYYLVNPNFNSKDDYEAFQSALVRVENLIGRASDILTILDKKINDNEAEHICNKVSAVDFRNLSATDYPNIKALNNYHTNYVEPCYDDINNLEDSKADKATTLEGYGITDGLANGDGTVKLANLAQDILDYIVAHSNGEGGGVTLTQVQTLLADYAKTSELDNKEDISNRVTSITQAFTDKDNSKYPTVVALLEYLATYYYDWDVTEEIFRSMTIDTNGNLTVEMPDGEVITVGTISSGSSVAGITLEELTTTLANYAKSADLATKEDSSNKVTSFDPEFSDKTKFPTVRAIIEYLQDRYYDFNNTYSMDEVDKMLSEINADTDEIPAYIRSEAEIISEKILSVTGESGDKNIIPFNLAVFTDLHFKDADKGRLVACKKAIDVICETAPVDVEILGGDYCNNYSATTGGTANEAREDISGCRKVFNDNRKRLWLRGNHDSNGYVGERLTEMEVYNRISRQQHTMAGYVENPADPYGCYGYMDFENAKIRVIVVNTSDNDDMGATEPEQSTDTAPIINCHNIGGVQLQWIADVALDFTDKTDASQWGVIFVSHLQIYHTNTWYNSHTYTDDDGKTWDCNLINLADLATAYRDKTSFNAVNNGVTVSKDFTNNASQAEILCFINGHGHALTHYTYNGFYFITCPNANAGGKESADGNTYAKTDIGTVKETAFNVITVDKANKKIYAWIYGAGYDRIFDLADNATIYTVTRSLTNCTSNSSVVTIENGSEISETITADNGYQISSLNVTMGGIDITASAVNGSVISIAEVTGNVVITAVAKSTDTEPDTSYTNLIPLSTDDEGNIYNEVGYKTGYRINSSFEEVSATGMCTTGYISYNSGDTLRVKNVTVSGASTPYIALYNANREPLLVLKVADKLVEADSEGVYTYTITAHSDTAYIRMALGVIDDTSNITVNEKIV